MSVLKCTGSILGKPLRMLMVLNWAIGGVLQLFWGYKILMGVLR